MNTNDNSALWQYCLWRYEQPGVEVSCLLLQDQYGLQINIILLCLYAQQLGVELSSEQLLDLHRQQEFYHRQYLWPLRNLRRSLAGQASVVALLNIELQLERHDIRFLQRWFSQVLPVWVAPDAEPTPNLDRYWQLFHGTQTMPGRSVL